MKIVSFLVGVFVLSQSAFGSIFPRVVDDIDLPQFLGKWYQIASTNPAFQSDCLCVTAEYELNESGNVQVTNSCRKNSIDGEFEVAIGEARPTMNPAKLNVSFGGFSLPFSNYWIVDLAEDYSYAVVSTPFRTPIWVLSRTPTMDAEIYEGITDRLKDQKFFLRRLAPTIQEGCNN